MEKQRVAIFGGSFSPPHYGHKAVISHLLAKEGFHAIWLLPVWQHPYNKELIDYSTRIQFLQWLCEDLDMSKIKISHAEKELGQTPSYMAGTMEALKKQHPNTDFTLVLGTDAKKDLPNWHRYNDLKHGVGFYFVPRQGYESSTLPEVSSSQIRELLALGKNLNGLTDARIATELAKINTA